MTNLLSHEGFIIPASIPQQLRFDVAVEMADEVGTDHETSCRKSGVQLPGTSDTILGPLRTTYCRIHAYPP
jgi:hypothetical protein